MDMEGIRLSEISQINTLIITYMWHLNSKTNK